jgi:hypothetical protein
MDEKFSEEMEIVEKPNRTIRNEKHNELNNKPQWIISSLDKTKLKKEYQG